MRAITVIAPAIIAAAVLADHTARAADPQHTITGPAVFKDADSPWVNGQELRIMNGIDAPELVQPCEKDGQPWFAGLYAAVAVNDMFAGRTLVCVDSGQRSYKRPLVTCTVDGEDVADRIVRAGWAFDYPKYSGGRHAEAEAQAHAAGRGMWAGTCAKPWVWRRKTWGNN